MFRHRAIKCNPPHRYRHHIRQRNPQHPAHRRNRHRLRQKLKQYVPPSRSQRLLHSNLPRALRYRNQHHVHQSHTADPASPPNDLQYASPPKQDQRPQFQRTLGLVPSIAVNMTQMCGIGPFITIPPMVAIMGGPQAMLGWLVGALLAMADGLVWAELGAAMPGSGGTYLYLREAFQYRTGRLMPFLFVWTAMIYIDRKSTRL